jgi:stage VI sporulation protein D
VTEASDKLQFEIYERVQLPEEIASLQELEELELIPHMQTLPGEDHVQLRGHLLLTGIYRGETAESPIRQLEHWIPMEISLPLYRVGRLDELTVDVEQFDVDLVSGRTLNVTGTLTLRGVQGGPAPEREWEGDGLRVVHQAPPQEIWPGLSGEVPVQASFYRLQGDGGDVVGLEPASEDGAPRPAGGDDDRYAADETDTVKIAARDNYAADFAAEGAGAAGSFPGEPGAARSAEIELDAVHFAAGESDTARYTAGESDAVRSEPGDSGAVHPAGSEAGAITPAAGESGIEPPVRVGGDPAAESGSEPGAAAPKPPGPDEPPGESQEEEVVSVREIPVPGTSEIREEPAAAAGAGDASSVSAASPDAEAIAVREAESVTQADAAHAETDDALAPESDRSGSAPDVSAAEEKPAVKVTLSGKREPAAAGTSSETVGWHSLVGVRAEREPAGGSATDGHEAVAAGDVQAGGGEARSDRGAAAEPDADSGAIPPPGGEAEPAAERAVAPPGGDELDWARLFRVRGSEASPFTRVRLCIVQEDEPLESVAERYQVQARLLQRFNNLTEPYVTKGQVLYIPRL